MPTSLIGKEVTLYISEWYIAVYYAEKWVERLPRLIGEQRHHINYRHVIDTLLRKPGGFRRYRFRDDLFPTLVFRQAWDQLNQWHAPRRADIIYLQILHLAARTLECEVATVLDILVAQGKPWTKDDVDRLLAPQPVVVPQLQAGDVDLSQYDGLLKELSYDAA